MIDITHRSNDRQSKNHSFLLCLWTRILKGLLMKLHLSRKRKTLKSLEDMQHMCMVAQDRDIPIKEIYKIAENEKSRFFAVWLQIETGLMMIMILKVWSQIPHIFRKLLLFSLNVTSLRKRSKGKEEEEEEFTQ